MDAPTGREAGGAGGADSVQLQQRGSTGGHQLGEFFLQDLDLLVDALELDDQLRCESTPGLAYQVARCHNVASLTPNADATSATEVILDVTS